VPKLIIEVRSSNDRWKRIHEKITEYLNAGVELVIVLDPLKKTAHAFPADDAPVTVTADQDLTLPGILEGFLVPVSRFFEE
jgi:Uma2 family endonuclease